MGLVRACSPFAIQHNGMPVVVNPGELYDEDDPLVRAHPTCFEPVRATAGVGVEQATANPGERRNTRRG